MNPSNGRRSQKIWRQPMIWPRPRGRALRSGGVLDPRVDLAAQHPEIDGLGEKRFSAALQCLALGLRIAIGGDHNDRYIGSSLALGKSSSPVIPGILMSDRIRISDTPAASAIRRSAMSPDWANSIVKRPW